MDKSRASGPKASQWGRIGDYLRRQFPPLLMVPIGFGRFFITYVGLQVWAQDGPIAVSTRAWVAATAVCALMLLQRVFDDLKDVDTDRQLAAAGDPKYQSRPIVTGHLLPEDLIVLRWSLTALVVALGLILGAHGLVLGLLFLCVWLSFKWFFYPPMKEHLLLAFITHSPLSLAYAAFAATVSLSDMGRSIGEDDLAVGFAVIAITAWMPIASWELSRKIRAPGQETDYQTYSKLLGYRLATLLPIIGISLCMTMLWILHARAPLPWIPLYAALAVGSYTIWSLVRFYRAPTPANADFEARASLFIVSVLVVLPFWTAWTRLSW